MAEKSSNRNLSQANKAKVFARLNQVEFKLLQHNENRINFRQPT